MSRDELEKWNQKYATGEYTPNDTPSPLLAAWLPRLPRGAEGRPSLRPRALDVACGLGRNALFLASQGYTVDAIDISSVALALARRQAVKRGLSVNWIQADLDSFSLPAQTYDVAVNNFYLNRGLAPQLVAALKPNGILLFEHHLISSEAEAGPSHPELRLKPGELPGLFPGWEILYYHEGLMPKEGRLAALAQMVARRPVYAPSTMHRSERQRNFSPQSRP